MHDKRREKRILLFQGKERTRSKEANAIKKVIDG
jgi:hypothetical protein